MAKSAAERQKSYRERLQFQRNEDRTKANLLANLPKAIRHAAARGSQFASQIIADSDVETLRNLERFLVFGPYPASDVFAANDPATGQRIL